MAESDRSPATSRAFRESCFEVSHERRYLRAFCGSWFVVSTVRHALDQVVLLGISDSAVLQHLQVLALVLPPRLGQAIGIAGGQPAIGFGGLLRRPIA